MNQLAKMVEFFTTHILMEFGVTKCRTLTTGRGNVKAEGFKTQQRRRIEMNENDTYRYLGVLQSR